MRSKYFVLSTVMIAGLLASAAPSQAFLDKMLGSKTETTQDNAKMDLPEYKGIKHAVGVKDFENAAGWAGHWDLSHNLSVMLESALFDSGRFVVVEREGLDAVLNEQDLVTGGRAAQSKTAQTGKLRSARYIANGAITEATDETSGTGGGVSIKGFRIGGSSGKSHITVIVKLVDTTTGEVVAKERIEGKAGNKGLNVGYSGSSFGGDLGGFNKTPIGEAAQDVINKAVEFISKSMEDFPLEGSVVKSGPDGKVIINRGSEFGVEVGQEFQVSTLGEELIDPDSGAVLGREEGQITATIKINKVDEKVAYGAVTDGTAPNKGDVVTLKK